MASRPRRNAARTTATREPSAPTHEGPELTDSEEETLPDPSARTIPSVEPHDPVATATAAALTGGPGEPATTVPIASIPTIVAAVLQAMRLQDGGAMPPPRIPSERRESAAASRHDREVSAQSSHAERERSSSAATMSSGKPRKFPGHGNNKYNADGEREHQLWINKLEEDHEHYPDEFRTDADRVYQAKRTIALGSRAAIYLEARQEHFRPRTCSWDYFKSEMLNACGAQETRDVENFEKWSSMKFQDTPRETQRALQSIERVLSFEIAPRQKLLQFRRIAPARLMNLLLGDRDLTDREALVEALEKVSAQLDLQKLVRENNAPVKPRNDAATTDAAKGKGQSGERGRGRGKGRGGSSRGTKRKRDEEPDDKPPAYRRRTDAEKEMLRKEDADKGRCFYCHKEGHLANACEEREKTAAVRAMKAASKKDAEAGKATAS